MSEPRGCLSLLVPRVADAPRLGVGLPKLDLASVHPSDRGAMTRAQRAAEAAHAAFARSSTADAATADLASQLGAMLAALHRLGRELKEARDFVAQNDPDRLARERTDLEMRRLGASAAEILALRTAADSLAARARLSEQVRGQVATLSARLTATGHDLEAFRGRVATAPGPDLGHELSAYLRSAELILEAHEQTRREIDRSAARPPEPASRRR
ncbi:MAG: hypothetical protein ABMA64_20535 [Myxococcota bacterium]